MGEPSSVAAASSSSRRRRLVEVQRFMLTTDSVTVAVEVPIYLTSEDLKELSCAPDSMSITTSSAIRST
jgi:hypothetical protein